jgi:CBS domain-containing protein
MKPKFETVGQVKDGKSLVTYADSSIIKVAEELAQTGWTGMPVIDRENRVIGIISQQDLLRAFRAYEPLLFLDEIKVKEVMTKPPVVIDENAPLQEASKIMEENHVYRLPVVKEGFLRGTVTGQDLLRAWLGTGIEEGAKI